MEILENEKNLTILDDGAFYYLFSYNSKIAIYCENSKSLAIGKNWDYSQSTLKHLKHFINNYTAYTYENKQQFKKFIENNPLCAYSTIF